MKARIGTVRCHKQILNSVSITNDVGGTSEIPVGIYRVRVTRVVGRGRLVGELLDIKDIAKSRKAGTTGSKPDDYKKYLDVNPSLYHNAVKAAAEFNPAIVYFMESDFTETKV